jgi:hypothetical protein
MNPEEIGEYAISWGCFCKAILAEKMMTYNNSD